MTQGIPDPKRQVKKVFAWGQRAVYPGLEQYNDADNAWGMVEFTNGKVLNLHVGRTLTNGYENRARIFGTKGTIVVSRILCPACASMLRATDLVANLARAEGRIRRAYDDCVSLLCPPCTSWLQVLIHVRPDFFGRFEQAFVDDLHHFAESIVKDQREWIFVP